MARVIKVWNDTTSAWEDVAVQQPDTSAFVSNSLVSGKGSLIAATADDTPADLPVGSNGQMLMADSSATAGLRYVDPPANRNLLINGAMQVAQRGTSTSSITTSGYYTADRWNLNLGTLGTWTESIETDGPSGSGFAKSVKLLCTTADGSPAAGDIMVLQQFLEGQDVQRIKKGTASAEQLSVSFWVKSNVTGTYVVELRDADNSRTVSATYSVSASATWEKKTITFPADTTGALDNDNARSFDLNFWLGAGTNFTSGTLATTWASTTNANRAVGQTNLAAATNNYWQVTGVQLETGPVATPFEFEPYEATLRKCQRYYQKSGTGSAYSTYGLGTAYDATAVNIVVPTQVTMRTAPTSVEYSSVYLSLYGGSTFTITALNLNSTLTHPDAVHMTATGASGLTQYRPYNLVNNNSTSGYVAFSAEL